MIKKVNSRIKQIKKKGGDIHIIGLCSDGGVHSHEYHIFQLIKFLNKLDLKVHFHMILDGRDSPLKTH